MGAPQPSDAVITAATTAVDSEHVVLGAMMSTVPDSAQLEITPEDFSEGVHARICRAIQRRKAQGSPADPTLIYQDLRGDQDLLALGGQTYLVAMVIKTPTWLAADHARIVTDRANRRRLMDVLSNSRESVLGDLDRPAFDHIAEAGRALGDLLNGASPVEANLTDARSAAIARVAAIEAEARSGKPRGLMTGLRCFDRRMGGLRPGWLVVMAARSSMGKTATARSSAMSAAMRNPDRQIVYFCVEMDRAEMSERMLSEISFLYGRASAIEYRDMGGDTLLFDDRSRLPDLATKVPENLILDDTPALSVEYIRRRLYALRRRGPIGAAFIDYLQIMQRPAVNGSNDAAVLQQMTSALKALARELGICIVLLSQLNREVEKREDKRPQLSDLRESGAIEQDANAVLLLFREHYYLTRSEPKRGADRLEWEMRCEETARVLEVIGAKNRGGATFTEKQTYFAEFDHVEDPS